MKNKLNKGRLVGLLLLIMFIPGFISVNMRGLSGSMINAANFLEAITNQSFQMKLAMMADTLATFIGLMIAVVVYPILQQYSKPIALLYLGLWLVQLTLVAMGNVGHLGLIAISEQFAGEYQNHQAPFQALGLFSIRIYTYTHFFTLLFFSIGAALLYYVFHYLKLVPQLLAIWGIITVTLVFSATILQIFKVEVSQLFYLQNGLFLLVLSIWLLIKGFPSATNQ